MTWACRAAHAMHLPWSLQWCVLLLWPGAVAAAQWPSPHLHLGSHSLHPSHFWTRPLVRVIPHVVTMTMSLLHPYAAVVLLHGCMLVLIDAQLGLRIGSNDKYQAILLKCSDDKLKNSPSSCRGLLVFLTPLTCFQVPQHHLLSTVLLTRRRRPCHPRKDTCAEHRAGKHSGGEFLYGHF